LLYYVFDVMMLAGKDAMNERLTARRELLQRNALPKIGRLNPRVAAVRGRPPGVDPLRESPSAGGLGSKTAR
jgi:ATP-dependent DNA ligase